MNWIDLVIFAIIVISALIGLLRGFVREAMSLGGWILSFWVALTFSAAMASLLDSSIDDPILRLTVAFILLMIISLIAVRTINFFAVHMVERSGMTDTDKVIGVVFGVLRGIVLVSVLVLLLGLTPFPKTDTWDNSFLMYYFEGLAVWLRDYMPGDVAGSFKF